MADMRGAEGQSDLASIRRECEEKRLKSQELQQRIAQESEVRTRLVSENKKLEKQLKEASSQSTRHLTRLKNIKSAFQTINKSIVEIEQNLAQVENPEDQEIKEDENDFDDHRRLPNILYERPLSYLDNKFGPKFKSSKPAFQYFRKPGVTVTNWRDKLRKIQSQFTDLKIKEYVKARPPTSHYDIKSKLDAELLLKELRKQNERRNFGLR